MRVKLAHGAVVAATIVGLTGCQSGPGGSGRGWWGAKNKPAANAALANAPAGPQLPSAGAVPTGNTPPAFGSLPPGAPATSAYPEQQTAYPTTNYPDAQAAAAGAYGAANPANSAQPSASLPATPSTGALPQSGPYNPAYAQGASAANPGGPADAYAPAGGAAYPATPANPVAYGGTSADSAYPGAPNGIRTADAAGHNGYSAPADAGYPNNAYAAPPAAAPTGNPAYPYSDPGRAVDQPPASGYGAPAGGTGTGAAASPAFDAPVQGNPGAGAASGDRYPQTNYSQSDSTYTPGSTGYTPPGSAPYQGPGTPAGTPAGAPPTTERRDPNWRPGSTSDYGPTRGARNGAGDSRSGVVPAGYETRGTSTGGGASSYTDRSIPDPNVNGHGSAPATASTSAASGGNNPAGAQAPVYNPSAAGNGAAGYGASGSYAAPSGNPASGY